MRAFKILLIGVLSCFASQWAPDHARADDGGGAELAASLAKDLGPCLKSLNKNYRFYHYANATSIQRTLAPGQSLADGVQRHLELWSEYYWNPSRIGLKNSGLYTAMDPVSSAAFGESPGDTSFLLYRLELPKGTRYFDSNEAIRSNRCILSARTERLMAGAGCEADLKSSFTLLNNGSKNPSCMGLLRSAYRKLNLRGTADNGWIATQYRECGPRSGRQFIWFDLKDLPADAVALFKKSPPSRGKAEWSEAVEIEQMWQASGGSRWPQLKQEAASSPKPVAQTLSESLLDCEGAK